MPHPHRGHREVRPGASGRPALPGPAARGLAGPLGRAPVWCGVPSTREDPAPSITPRGSAGPPLLRAAHTHCKGTWGVRPRSRQAQPVTSATVNQRPPPLVRRPWESRGRPPASPSCLVAAARGRSNRPLGPSPGPAPTRLWPWLLSICAPRPGDSHEDGCHHGHARSSDQAWTLALCGQQPAGLSPVQEAGAAVPGEARQAQRHMLAPQELTCSQEGLPAAAGSAEGQV